MTIPPSCASLTAAVFFPARTSRCWRRANTRVRSRSASRASDSVFHSGWPGPCSSSGVSALPDTAPRNVIEKPPVKAVKADKVHAAVAALPGEERVLRAAEKALTGQTRGLRALLPFLGPAFVASVAYVDPGNFATDLAEFIGAAIGIHLLFPSIPLFMAGIITGFAAFGILSLQSRGFRGFEAVITVLVAVIVGAFAFEVVLARPSVGAVATGLLIPRFNGTESVLLGAGILGATVMPHVIYLHSALTQRRVVGATEAEQQKIFNFEKWDVVIAMGIAGVVNVAMLTLAAAALHAHNIIVPDLDAAFRALGRTLDHGADIFFGLGLLASGLSSSSVGTLAGQVVMQGFIHRQIPLCLRRAITMVPPLAVIAIGLDPTRALVLSQVVLSFGIPFALIPLLLFCRDRGLMGTLVNRPTTTAVATLVVSVIVSLNAFLIFLLVSGH